MQINLQPALDYDDVLLLPQRSVSASRSSIDLMREFYFYHASTFWYGIPLVISNMDSTGTMKMADIAYEYQMIACLHKYYSVEEIMAYFGEDSTKNKTDSAFVSIGFNQKKDLAKVKQLKKFNPNINFCIDVANGYVDDFVKYCAKIRDIVGTGSIIMAGNIATSEMCQEYIIHGGVDICKIGIGPGSACTTRLKTGVGVPQLSAIMSCSQTAHGLKNAPKRLGLICADGGCRRAGDVVKAFAAGADFVMLGGMFAACREADGEIIEENGKKYKKFYGMSSKTAQKKYNGIVPYATSEGREKQVEFLDQPASEVIDDILGGIRSACTYIGADSIKSMNKCACFQRVGKVHYDQTV